MNVLKTNEWLPSKWLLLRDSPEKVASVEWPPFPGPVHCPPEGQRPPSSGSEPLTPGLEPADIAHLLSTDCMHGRNKTRRPPCGADLKEVSQSTEDTDRIRAATPLWAGGFWGRGGRQWPGRSQGHDAETSREQCPTWRNSPDRGPTGNVLEQPGRGSQRSVWPGPSARSQAPGHRGPRGHKSVLKSPGSLM